MTVKTFLLQAIAIIVLSGVNFVINVVVFIISHSYLTYKQLVLLEPRHFKCAWLFSMSIGLLGLGCAVSAILLEIQAAVLLPLSSSLATVGSMLAELSLLLGHIPGSQSSIGSIIYIVCIVCAVLSAIVTPFSGIPISGLIRVPQWIVVLAYALQRVTFVVFWEAHLFSMMRPWSSKLPFGSLIFKTAVNETPSNEKSYSFVYLTLAHLSLLLVAGIVLIAVPVGFLGVGIMALSFFSATVTALWLSYHLVRTRPRQIAERRLASSASENQLCGRERRLGSSHSKAAAPRPHSVDDDLTGKLDWGLTKDSESEVDI